MKAEKDFKDAFAYDKHNHNNQENESWKSLDQF